MNAELFTDEPAPVADDLFTDEPAPQPKSALGFAKNLGNDALGALKGVIHTVNTAVPFAAKLPLHNAQSLMGLAQGKSLEETPSYQDFKTMGKTALNVGEGLWNEGERIGLVGEGGLLNEGIHPIDAANKFAGALYDKPLTTALDVLPIAQGAGKALGIGGKSAKALEVASGADDVAQAAGAAETVTPGLTFQETVANLGKKIPGELQGPIDQAKNFVTQKYAKVSRQPGWANTLADYAEENARNLSTKSAGASYGQLNKLGPETTQALQDLMLERGIVSPKVGPIGAKAKVEGFRDVAGSTIGKMREAAASRGAVHNMDALIEKVKANLDQKYMKGMYSGQKGSYMKALEELKKTEPTIDKVANKISEMFKESRKQDPLRQTSGPMADVARELRNANEGLMKKVLSPKELESYTKALDEYGAMTQIREFFKRKNFRDASGRLGPGAGITRQAIQSFFDMVGYRGQAQISKKFADFVRKNPEIAQNPKMMFQKYIDEAVEAIDDIGAPE